MVGKCIGKFNLYYRHPDTQGNRPHGMSLNELTFEFGYPVPCDQIIPGNFSLLGPEGPKSSLRKLWTA
jgi:hypothetical protein